MRKIRGAALIVIGIAVLGWSCWAIVSWTPLAFVAGLVLIVWGCGVLLSGKKSPKPATD